MSELDYKESWVPKNWCFWPVVLEKTLESSLGCKEIQPVHPKGISPEYLLEGLMLKLKVWSFGHVIQRTDSLGKTLMLGETEGRRRTAENEIVRWHHWLDGYECEQDPGVGDGQGILVSCSPWGRRVRHNWVTELNWTDPFVNIHFTIFTLVAPLFGA